MCLGPCRRARATDNAWASAFAFFLVGVGRLGCEHLAQKAKDVMNRLMLRRSRFWGAEGCVFALTTPLPTCANSSNADAVDVDAATETDAGQDAPSPNLAGLGDGGPRCPMTCSSDLHQVLDSRGQVVANCPPDQGCTANACIYACVPACESARANKS